VGIPARIPLSTTFLCTASLAWKDLIKKKPKNTIVAPPKQGVAAVYEIVVPYTRRTYQTQIKSLPIHERVLKVKILININYYWLLPSRRTNVRRDIYACWRWKRFHTVAYYPKWRSEMSNSRKRIGRFSWMLAKGVNGHRISENRDRTHGDTRVTRWGECMQDAVNVVNYWTMIINQYCICDVYVRRAKCEMCELRTLTAIDGNRKIYNI